MSLARRTPAPELAIIGGTGIERLEDFILHQRLKPSSPFGDCSGSILVGELHGRSVAVLNRHGRLKGEGGAAIAPHAVNYRANLWLLKQLGVNRVLALNAVGGITADWPPGRLGAPHDLIDYSYGRQQTFFDANSPWPYEQHVELSQPFSPTIASQLATAAAAAEVEFQQQGVIAVTQGPRLETPAEVRRLEADGCHLVGMTSMPEAALAAELDLEYGSLAFSVNWAAGKNPSQSIQADQSPEQAGQKIQLQVGQIHAEIEAVMARCQQQISRLLKPFISALN